MKTLFRILGKRSARFIWWLSFLMMLLIVGLSSTTSYIMYLEPFIALPIILACWYSTRKSGILLALLSAVTLFISKQLIDAPDLHIESAVYDGISHLVAYVFLAILITNFRSIHQVELIAADTDSMTGLLNPRGFYAELANELLRSIRYKRTFSLAYIDIDNFKAINDSLGHSAGDDLLKAVAACLKSSLRATDSVARLGGDEYACLLPETKTEEAKKVYSIVEQRLTTSMRSHNWQVSFSVGIVTFETLPEDVKEAIAITDKLMYSVKNNKKDNTAYMVWQGRITP